MEKKANCFGLPKGFDIVVRGLDVDGGVRNTPYGNFAHYVESIGADVLAVRPRNSSINSFNLFKVVFIFLISVFP
mgnify:CR=1 FL=1